MRYAILAAAAAGSFIAAGSASAQVKGQEYFGLGGGGGMVMHDQPCPDIPCNVGDTCSCVNSSGNFQAKGVGGYKSTSGTYVLEVSADNSTGIDNGGGGRCFGSDGFIVLTINGANLTLPFSGPGCRIGSSPQGGGDPNAVGISAPTYIESGTGRFKNPQGSGNFSATLKPGTNVVLFNIAGYGNFSGK